MQTLVQGFRRALPYLRKGARVTRTVGLATAIGYSGYCTGVHDALADPEGTTKKIMHQILEHHAKNGEGRAVGAPALLAPDKRDSLLVSRLGNELVVAAQMALAAEADEIHARLASGAKDVDKEADTERLDKIKQHQREFDRKWRFLVIDNDTINAFVTDQLPGVVFVHRGLIKLMERQPERLSFVIGHELSHHLLEHNEQDRRLTAGLSLLQLLVFTAIDPTGLVSFLVELGAMSTLFSYTFQAPSSREHEFEADQLGLQLVVRACRDPREAIRAHEVLARYEQDAGGAPDKTMLGASHPATLERVQRLREALPQAEKDYKQAGCVNRKRQVMRALGVAGA
jgi:predicted Zn-dependent protease